MPILEMHLIVSGQVQGVGFRAAVLHYARRLEIKGTVRNLPDGNVEIYAQGPKEKLDRLIEHLHKHNGLALIHSMDVNHYSPKNLFADFAIIR